MGDVEFTAEDLASCKKFCREMEVFLREEARRFRKRLRLTAGCAVGGHAVAGAGRHQE